VRGREHPVENGVVERLAGELRANVAPAGDDVVEVL
jgi:hypothetical protein